MDTKQQYLTAEQKAMLDWINNGEKQTMEEFLNGQPEEGRQNQEMLERYRSATELNRQPRARNSDPVTSNDAAATVDHSPLERQIVDYLWSVGPQTQKEISLALRIPEISCSPILRPLARDHVLYNPEQKRPNPGTGRMALAWDVVRS